MCSRLVLGKLRSDRTFELAHRAFDRLTGIAGVVFHHDGVVPHQPGLQGAVNAVVARLRLAVDIGQMRLDPRDTFGKPRHGGLHHALQVVGWVASPSGTRSKVTRLWFSGVSVWPDRAPQCEKLNCRGASKVTIALVSQALPLNPPFMRIGLPTFQSVTTSAPKKNCFSAAGVARAAQISGADAAISVATPSSAWRGTCDCGRVRLDGVRQSLMCMWAK